MELRSSYIPSIESVLSFLPRAKLRKQHAVYSFCAKQVLVAIGKTYRTKRVMSDNLPIPVCLLAFNYPAIHGAAGCKMPFPVHKLKGLRLESSIGTLDLSEEVS